MSVRGIRNRPQDQPLVLSEATALPEALRDGTANDFSSPDSLNTKKKQLPQKHRNRKYSWMSTENWSQPLLETGRRSEPRALLLLHGPPRAPTPHRFTNKEPEPQSLWEDILEVFHLEKGKQGLWSPQSLLFPPQKKKKKRKEGGRGRQPRGGQVGRKGWKGSGSGKLVARKTQHERDWHGGSWECFESYRRSYGILDFFHILDVPETGGGRKLKQNCPLGFTIRELGISWSPLGPIPHQGDFCSGPVVKTPHSQYRVPGLDPWSGNYILHSTTKNSHVTAKTGCNQINWKKVDPALLLTIPTLPLSSVCVSPAQEGRTTRRSDQHLTAIGQDFELQPPRTGAGSRATQLRFKDKTSKMVLVC